MLDSVRVIIGFLNVEKGNCNGNHGIQGMSDCCSSFSRFVRTKPFCSRSQVLDSGRVVRWVLSQHYAEGAFGTDSSALERSKVGTSVGHLRSSVANWVHAY
jgi:hypothetical protein